MKKLLVRTIIGLLVLIAVVYGVGMALPRNHLVSSRIRLSAPRDSVFAVLRAFGDYPKWDKDFTSSVRGPSRNGHEVWVQEANGMTVSIELTSIQDPSRLVSWIVTSEKSDWGGVWTYDLVATGSGTTVTITEKGWIRSPIFRVMMKAMGTHSTMDGLLKALGTRFGEQVKPEHVK